MAGTVVLTHQRIDGVVRYAVITATADAADGTFPTKTLRALGVYAEGTFLALQTNPGAVAPTDNYDITLIDGDGVDRFNSVGLNRDTSNSERVAVTGAPFVADDETLTLTIAGNSVNSAVVVITLYWSGLVAGVGSGAAGGGVALDAASLAALETISVESTSLPTPAATATLTNQTDQATSVTLLASSATRKGFRIFNDSTVICYVKYGATASTTSFTAAIPAGGYFEENHYYGRVDAIWASDASGSARVTELV